MVMSGSRGGNDGEGKSGSKSSEANCDGFLGSSSQDWAFSQSLSQSGTFQPHLFFDSDHNLIGQIQRPELLNQPRNPMYNNNINNLAVPSEFLIRVKISWSHGGDRVAVMGSWDNWATREPLQREANGFFVTKALPPGEYQYLFIVDGYLRCSPDLPWSDASGSACNVLDLRESESELPEHLSEFETPESPPSSYNNELLSEDDYSKNPPEAPPQLQSAILNDSLSSCSDGQIALPEPQHLNHLFIQTHLETRFVALRSTRRFRKKYVTMVLYKPSR